MGAEASAQNGATWWQPAVSTTWQYQLRGTINQTNPASFYIVDGFDTAATTVASLRAKGKKVGCYISAGSYEDWRPDADRFPQSVLGDENGWPGERWLDIRNVSLLEPIMASRMDMCKAKGFDAVDPDNVDGYTNDTGFSLRANDQLVYNRMLARLAHERGLAVGLKNDVDQAAALQPDFDFAINEQCWEYNECGTLASFIAAGKPVFNVEYRGKQSTICPKARAKRFRTMRKQLSLGATVVWTC